MNIFHKYDKILTKKIPNIPIIIDPIISSTTGKKILKEEEIISLKENLIKNSYLITPNINEASILGNITINNLEDMKIAAKNIKEIGVKNVLIKGGHLNSNEITHLLLKENNEEIIINNKKIQTNLEVRGTGCMLSTAIACFLKQNTNLEEAIKKADDFVNKEIKRAQKIGCKLVSI